MGIKCPSESWDDYVTQNEENPAEEAVHWWIRNKIESVRPTLNGEGVVVRQYFPTAGDDPMTLAHVINGFPEDPDLIADELVNFIFDHPALAEVAVLLAKLEK